MSNTFYITEIFRTGRNENIVVMCADGQPIGEELGRAGSQHEALSLVRAICASGDTLILAPLRGTRQVLTLENTPASMPQTAISQGVR